MTNLSKQKLQKILDNIREFSKTPEAKIFAKESAKISAELKENLLESCRVSPQQIRDTWIGV